MSFRIPLCCALFWILACRPDPGAFDGGGLFAVPPAFPGLEDAGGTQDGGFDAGPGLIVECLRPEASVPVLPEPLRIAALGVLADYCDSVSRGFSEAELASRNRCGASITDEDLPRIPYFRGLSEPFGTIVEDYLSCGDGSLLRAELAGFERSLDAGRMTYGATLQIQCIAIGRAARDGGLDPYEAAQDAGNPCTRVLVGLVDQGGACEHQEDCVEGTFCDPLDVDSARGTCRAFLAVGAPCVPGRRLCGVDSFCSDASGSGFVCTPASAALEPCGAELPCRSDLACVASACTPIRGEDDPCVDVEESADCAEGRSCVADAPGAASGHCRRLAAESEACGETTDARPACGDCLACVSGTCERLQAGGACTLELGNCLEDELCDPLTLRCRPYRRDGELCRSAPSAASNPGDCLYADSFCARSSASSVSGICSRIPALGAACGNRYDLSAQCRGGHCAFDGTVGGVGTCTDLLPKAGETCGTRTGLSPDCEAPLVCQRIGSAAEGTCGSAGSHCESCATGACAPGLWCDRGPDPIFRPTCQVQFAPGEICSADPQCSTGYCDRALGVCTVATGTTCQSCGGLGALSSYLLFAIVLLPRLARRRSR